MNVNFFVSFKFFCLLTLFLSGSLKGEEKQADTVFPPPPLTLIPPSSDTPITVSVGLFIIDFKDIIMSPETFSIVGYLPLQWHDPRLKFDPSTVQEKFYKKGEIWDPAIEFVNNYRMDFEEYDLLKVSPDGNVQTTVRFSGTFASSFDLKRFPFDSQILNIIVESLSYNERFVILKPNPELNEIGPDAFLEEWQFDKIVFKVSDEWEVFEQQNYSRAVFSVAVQRLSNFYTLRYLVPLFLVTMLSFITLWLPVHNFEWQLDNSRTIVFTIIAMGIAMNFSLPHLGYMTWMDSFIIACFFTVLLLPFENLIIYQLFEMGYDKEATEIRAWTRICLPVGFVILSALSFWRVLH